MAKYNPNLAKLHHSYTFEEVAGLLGVHKNTVATWVKDGLPCLKSRKPFLILGKDLKQYLQGKRDAKHNKCKPNEMYCVTCKKPQKPLGLMVDYLPDNSVKGRLVGICEVCEGGINRFTTAAKLEELSQYFDLSNKGGD